MNDYKYRKRERTARRTAGIRRPVVAKRSYDMQAKPSRATIPITALAWAVALVSVSPLPAQHILRTARDALRSGDTAEAVRITTEWIDREGDPQGDAHWIRGQAHDAAEEYGAAMRDYDFVSKHHPREAGVLLALGSAAFKHGDMESAITAFDRAARVKPEYEPQLWQRGIAHYYAGRYEDGARQFEIHRRVNPADVENSVWHFLCVAATEGFEEARQRLLPVSGDSRVPMAEVLELFRGDADPAKVLEKAEQAARGNPNATSVMYAHLYLGLYFEAAGDDRSSAEHIGRAVETGLRGNYMWQVARVHHELRSQAAQ